MDFKVFYYPPINPEKMLYLYILEGILMLANSFFVLLVLPFVHVMKLHPNLKVMFIGTMFLMGPGVMARIVILLFQMNILHPGVIENCDSCLGSNYSPVILLCSWLRGTLFAFGMSALLWFSLERTFALYFIRDYEHKPRFWVSALLLYISSCTTYFSSFVYMSNFVPSLLLGILAVIVTLLGPVLFVFTYKRTKRIRDIVSDNHVPGSKHDYTLTLRFQIEENLWCAKILGTIYTTAIVAFSYVGVLFFLAYSDITVAYFDSETIQYLDAAFNISLLANGPVIGIGAMFNNEYVRKTLREMFFVFKKNNKVAPTKDEGEQYFGQLKNQWEQPFVERERTARSKRR